MSQSPPESCELYSLGSVIADGIAQLSRALNNAVGWFTSSSGIQRCGWELRPEGSVSFFDVETKCAHHRVDGALIIPINFLKKGEKAKEERG